MTLDAMEAGGGGDLFAANLKGSLLAVASSAFIGVSFIVKKKGLRRAGAAGARAGAGGYGYLLEPLWWVGMVTMLVGEIANFIAYMFAPAVLVTPLGALSIIVSAVLAHFTLNEKLHRVGVLGCGLCIVGSTMIILHAPQERTPSSVEQIWNLATQPSFLCYAAIAVGVSLFLMLYCAPRYGQTNIIVYVAICSVVGSLTVMSIKAVGIAIKLTIEGINQAGYFQTWVFAVVSTTCIVIQLVYLNKVHFLSHQLHEKEACFTSIFHKAALDTFNTAVVSPIYYAMFTTLTILASAIMFKDWSGQRASNIASEICGFLTVLAGTVVLHSTREPDQTVSADLYAPLPPKIYWHIQGNGDIGKQREDDSLACEFITVVRQDYFV
ncbi:probable magnesium transporter NIPA6 isoform X1 [Miscanthus floridulus]|uniref:probable magnesium transporter NIPA6 isoform X1 n=1 Tax=Miscanthus floridulus TaxID=154761 RepID=UPI003459EA08